MEYEKKEGHPFRWLLPFLKGERMKDKTFNSEWHNTDRCPYCGYSLAYTAYQGKILKEECQKCGWKIDHRKKQREE